MVSKVIPASPSNLFLQSPAQQRSAQDQACLPPFLERLPSSGKGAGGLTFPLHAHDQALLIATVLAAVPLTLVDEAVFVIPTRVDEVFPYGSLEEPLAAFTAVHTIVLSCSQEKNSP